MSESFKLNISAGNISSFGVGVNKGFTIVEMLVSIFLLTVGVGAAFTVAQRVLIYSSISEQRLGAIYLAQEGLEVVRNIRDSNWLAQRIAPTDWDKGLPSGEYNLDYKTRAFPDSRCSGSFLKFDGSFYNCQSGQDSIFQRTITISNKVDLNGDAKPDKMRISAKVTWQERGRVHIFTAREDLYNWQSE